MGKAVFWFQFRDRFDSLAAALDTLRHDMHFNIPQHGSLDAAVGEVSAQFVRRMAVFRVAVTVLNLRKGKLYSVGIAMLRQEVDDRPTGVAKLQ